MMFHDLVSAILEDRRPSHNIWFAGDFHTPAPFSYQVNFPRLELVLEGCYINKMESSENRVTKINATAGDAIFIPPNCWNYPYWNTDCSVLSILFGRRQLGLSLVSKRKDEKTFFDVQKHSIRTNSGAALDNVLMALNSLSSEHDKKPMDELLLQTLLQYCKKMLEHSEEPSRDRVRDLYQQICVYIQENYHHAISRENISERFNISANHLSRMFRQQGHMTLADYIIWVRIDRAKFMLKKYNFKLSEVAHRCGFKDVNYFCRVFKKRTGHTPTAYRNSN
ncbi:AraC family transcriptional regulator [Vibrio hannami]|uniref:AraC family transcriptional regulator n=1 Tax=Vibrio hannami TaxID=2717094 RepID=UPI0024104340|nr:AraC family transcriptional regulator [Vibrio hannami]MDG3085332.1 AraC family transcriptional regulator [Vibrio hannami]